MNIKTVTTTDGVNAVDFGAAASRFFWFRNIGTSAVYVSGNSDITAGGDGVAELAVGNSVCVEALGGKIYVLGAGKVEIYNTGDKFCPFRNAPVSDVSDGGGIDGMMSEVISNPKGSDPIRIKLLGDSITNGAKGSNFDSSGEIICITGNTYIDGVKTPVNDGNAFANPKAMRVNTNGHCWANSLKNYFEKKFNCEVLNFGCGGFSSYNIINHINELIQDEDDIIIISIGINDRNGTDPLHRCATTIETYKKNIQAIYEYCQNHGKKVVFISSIPAATRNEGLAGTIPSPDDPNIIAYESKAEFPETGDTSMVYLDNSNGLYYRWIVTPTYSAYIEIKHFHAEDIDNAIFAFANRYHIPYISMFKLFSSYCKYTGTEIETLLADNLHPNDAGYDIMFYLISNALGVATQIPDANW